MLFLVGVIARAQECLRSTLGDTELAWVGVHCAPEVAAPRKAHRLDRIEGMARQQAMSVHTGDDYDVEIDTTYLTTHECAYDLASQLLLKVPPVYPSTDGRGGMPAVIDRVTGMTFANAGTLGTLPGKRDELVSHLTQRSDHLKEIGCLSYEVGVNDDDPDTVFVVELWESAAAHQSSLALPEVQASIAAARPLLSGMFGGFRFEVVGSPLHN